MASSKSSKLTYLITGLQYGGANVGMVRLLSELSPADFDVTVISLVETSPDVISMLPDHVTIHQLGISSPLDCYKLGRLVPRLIRTDILVCSLFHASLVGTVIGTICRIPSILVWQHSTENQSLKRDRGYRLVYQLSDRVLADSEAVQMYLSTEQNVPTEKIDVLPIAGIDMDEFSPGRAKEESHEAVHIGTVGRLRDIKGYPELLECARRLGDAYRFTIIGDGPERERYEREAPNNVRFLGRVHNEEIPAHLRTFNIYFQPSRSEGLCMTVIEAMACGIPVVASSVGGITESMVHGETGYLCKPGDIAGFCDRLAKLESSQKMRREMGSAGRNCVVTQYSREKLVERFRDSVDQTKTV